MSATFVIYNTGTTDTAVNAYKAGESVTFSVLPTITKTVTVSDLLYEPLKTVLDGMVTRGFLAYSVARNALQIYTITNAAAASTTAVHAAVNASAANAITTGFTNPDFPRNVTGVFGSGYDGGDLTVVGTDQFGFPVTETIVAASASTVVGVKIFKTVTSASKTTVGTTSTVSIGTGSKLGVGFDMAGTEAIVTTDGVAALATLDATYSAFLPASVPNAALDYVIIAK